MSLKNYVITWNSSGNFSCEDVETLQYINDLFRLFKSGYSYNSFRTLIDFVDSIDATWIVKPVIEPIEIDNNKIF